MFGDEAVEGGLRHVALFRRLRYPKPAMKMKLSELSGNEKLTFAMSSLALVVSLCTLGLDWNKDNRDRSYAEYKSLSKAQDLGKLCIEYRFMQTEYPDLKKDKLTTAFDRDHYTEISNNWAVELSIKQVLRSLDVEKPDTVLQVLRTKEGSAMQKVYNYLSLSGTYNSDSRDFLAVLHLRMSLEDLTAFMKRRKERPLRSTEASHLTNQSVAAMKSANDLGLGCTLDPDDKMNYEGQLKTCSDSLARFVYSKR